MKTDERFKPIMDAVSSGAASKCFECGNADWNELGLYQDQNGKVVAACHKCVEISMERKRKDEHMRYAGLFLMYIAKTQGDIILPIDCVDRLDSDGGMEYQAQENTVVIKYKRGGANKAKGGAE